jgi:2-polyprenyl-6-methoxyphenol hydroxylase-like FAD-dependent oxidoreductase
MSEQPWVVVGGSVAGLAAAAALSRVVEEVVVVERSEEVAGTVAPQGGLPHVMCLAGNRVLEDLFPGFAQALLDSGAVPGGEDPRRLAVHWPAAGAVRRHLRLPDLGFPRALCGRRTIEPELRRRVAALPNVRLVHDVATDVVRSGARVAGVRLRGGDVLESALLVDATGRGGALRAALGEAGRPLTTEVGVDLRYAGYVVERGPDDGDGAELVVVQNTPDLPRIGVALPLDAKRWHVVLGGYFGIAPPTRPDELVAFARSLADPALVPLLERPLLEEPRRYTFRSSRRCHWERARAGAEGLVAVGDAVASFNPIYGQGMSSALLQAEALAEVVARHGTEPGVERRVARRLGRVVAGPWAVATGGDFAYARTTGVRPRGQRPVGRYLERVMRSAATDETVNGALTAVQQLLAEPSVLFRPRVVARVAAAG